MSNLSFVYKVCVIGNGGVGKSSAVRRYSEGIFSEDYQVTVGVNHSSQTISFEGDEGRVEVKVIIWDLGGQDKFRFIRPMFYRAARGLVLMFDITNKRSFEDLPKWLNEARENIGYEVPIVLVANKVDLPDHQISEEEIARYADYLGAEYIMASVKTGENVENVFAKLAEALYNNRKPSVPSGSGNPTAAVTPWQA